MGKRLVLAVAIGSCLFARAGAAVKGKNQREPKREPAMSLPSGNNDALLFRWDFEMGSAALIEPLGPDYWRLLMQDDLEGGGYWFYVRIDNPTARSRTCRLRIENFLAAGEYVKCVYPGYTFDQPQHALRVAETQ